MGDHLVESASRFARRAFVVLGGISLTLAASSLGSQGQHVATEPIPDVGKVELENDSVTVVRMHMAPHARTPMHDIASPRLVIWMTEAHLKDTGADGSVTDFSRPAGSIDWVTPRRHMGENLSGHDLDFLVVIPKITPAPGSHGASPP
jgi:hypothetical protein